MCKGIGLVDQIGKWPTEFVRVLPCVARCEASKLAAQYLTASDMDWRPVDINNSRASVCPTPILIRDLTHICVPTLETVSCF